MKRINPTTKRKIAGVIAIILVLILILGSIAPIFFRTAYGAEPQQFDVEAQLGFNGTVKIEENAPIYIKVTNNSGKTFKGKASVMTKNVDYDDSFTFGNKSEDDKTIEYFSELELASGETKEIYGSIPISVIESSYNVQLINNKGKTVMDKAIPVTTDRNDAIWLGQLSDSTRTRDALGANYAQLENHFGCSFVTDVTPQLLEYLDSINILVINDFDMNSLDAVQKGYIENWVSNGGCLMIGYDGDIRTQNWFGDLSESYGARSPDSFSEKLDLYENMVVPAYVDSRYWDDMRTVPDYLDDEELLKLMSVLIYYGEKGISDQFVTKLMLEMYNGNYDFYTVIDDECESLLAADPGFDINKSMDFMPTAVSATSYAAYSLGSGSVLVFSPATMVNDMLNAYVNIGTANKTSNYSSIALEKPSEILGGIFLGVIMLYAIFIGPILYVILKKKNKKESAVKIIPLSALAMTAFIVVCSIGSSFQRPMVSVVNLVDASEGGLRPVKGEAVCAAPIKGEVRIKNDRLKNVKLKNRNRYDWKSCRISLNSFDYTEFGATKWNSNTFGYEDTMQLNGGLSAVITNVDYANDLTTVTITNNTGYDLKNVCLCNISEGADYVAAKKLANGESIDYTAMLKYDYAVMNTYGPHKDNDYRKFRSLSPNERSAATDGLSGIRVTGFADNDFSGDFRMNGRKAVKNEITALYTYVPENRQDSEVPDVIESPMYATYPAF